MLHASPRCRPVRRRKDALDLNGWLADTIATLSKLNDLHDKMQSQDARLAAIEKNLTELQELLVNQRTIKEAYTSAEVAQILGKRPFTVREWCRHGRIRAEKGQCGRGGEKEWRISHGELVRYQNEGLLPIPSFGWKP